MNTFQKGQEVDIVPLVWGSSRGIVGVEVTGRRKEGVDEPNPRHWQKLGLAASFPT